MHYKQSAGGHGTGTYSPCDSFNLLHRAHVTRWGLVPISSLLLRSPLLPKMPKWPTNARPPNALGSSSNWLPGIPFALDRAVPAATSPWHPVRAVDLGRKFLHPRQGSRSRWHCAVHSGKTPLIRAVTKPQSLLPPNNRDNTNRIHPETWWSNPISRRPFGKRFCANRHAHAAIWNLSLPAGTSSVSLSHETNNHSRMNQHKTNVTTRKRRSLWAEDLPGVL